MLLKWSLCRGLNEALLRYLLGMKMDNVHIIHYVTGYICFKGAFRVPTVLRRQKEVFTVGIDQ